MAFELNLAQSERRVLPDGWYKAKTEIADFRPAGNREGQDALVHLELVTVNNEKIGEDDPNGIKLYRDQSCGQKSLWSLKEIVEAHFGKVEGDDDNVFSFEWEDLLNVEMWVFISLDDEFDGKARNVIDTWAHLESELDEDGNPDVKDAGTRILGEPVEDEDAA